MGIPIQMNKLQRCIEFGRRMVRASLAGAIRITLIALTLISFLMADPAKADKRVALVVGNSSDGNLTQPDSPRNDGSFHFAQAPESKPPSASSEPAPAGEPAPIKVKPQRITQTPPGAPGTKFDASQRVVLYDEDPSDPKGRQYVGWVTWRAEPTGATASQKADIAVQADIVVPERKLRMTLSLQRNTDASLPASHVVELKFILPQDFEGGGISNVPGILMKSNEQARGTPLAALAVKVTSDFFLVGLSNVPTERERNLQFLQERFWFDIPLVYANNRRAIIAIEKGDSGAQVFKTAFTAWGQYPAAAQSPLAAQTPAAAASETGSYVVLVSSQRTEEDAQASYRALQEKYPDFLGTRTPLVKRADIGAAGVFYRVTVGPFQTSDEASRFCGDLKTAGGQCIVQRY